jgi:AcrR family transcriptional regulator
VSADPAVRPRRTYDSTLRRARAQETRERIVAAAAELLHGSSIRDWQGLTIRAVAERAGVNERTVYRHFANERALRDAVMQRLEQESGIDLDSLRLDDVADAAARIFRLVATYPSTTGRELDPTLAEANRRQHGALLAAVTERTPRWSESDRRLAAAMLDVLWSVGAYERLVTDWQLAGDDAIRAITWVIGLVEAAVRDGKRPRPARQRPL